MIATALAAAVSDLECARSLPCFVGETLRGFLASEGGTVDEPGEVTHLEVIARILESRLVPWWLGPTVDVT